MLVQGLPKVAGQSGWGKLMASFQSADDMLDEVNFCVSCLAPLGGPRIAAALRKVRCLCGLRQTVCIMLDAQPDVNPQ